MEKTNFEIFIDTVNTLKTSQGFYSRISRQIREMDAPALEALKNELNALPKWAGTLDCVLYLEA